MELTIREPLLALLISFSLASLITPLFRRLALRLKIVDYPNQAHKSHSEPIPYLGGTAIVFTCILLGIVSFFEYRELFLNQRSFLFIMVAPILLSIVGLFDDIRNLSAAIRFVIQSIAATLISFLFYSNNLFGAPSGIALIDFAIFTFWIVGITNAINLLDNLDGGAGGVIVIASVFLAANAILGDQYFLGALSAVLAGATMGFLVWNLYPARIYLGDSGALFLGSVISILIVRLDPEAPTALSSWVVAFSLVAIPILDTTVVVFSRLASGVSPFVGARDHISHRLLNLGLSKRKSALTLWGLAIYFCLFSVLLNFANPRQSIFFMTVICISWVSLAFYFLKNLNFKEFTNS